MLDKRYRYLLLSASVELTMHALFRLALAAALVVGLAGPAQATSLAPLSVDQMTDASDLIVRGTVERTWSDIDMSSGHIVSYADIRVTHGVKGAVTAGDFLTVETPGGVIDGDVALVDAAARYAEGEDVFLFLAEKRLGTSYGTVGMFLGKFTVKLDPQDGQPMIVRFTVPWDQRFDARFVPNPPVAERVSVTSFEQRVQARVAAGWDGTPIPGMSPVKLRQINKLQPGVR